jgi:hypothetical protein
LRKSLAGWALAFSPHCAPELAAKRGLPYAERPSYLRALLATDDEWNEWMEG